jgi:predicted outer membrane repeat protein
MWTIVSRTTRSADRNRPRRASFRPRLECLEGRWVPSTITVTSPNDGGTGSLRAAVASAHNGDTINFATTLDGQTITLTSGELLLSRNITIAGPSDRSVTISGGNASRVFELSLHPKPTVTLSGLTISNGNAPGPGSHSFNNGGGILNEGVLTITNCTLSQNSSPRGGGIENDAGATLTINSSTLSYNTARNDPYGSGGGAVDNLGTLAIHGSTLSFNSSAGGGGAISTALGPVTIDNHSVLSHNTADGGGAIAGMVPLNQAIILNDSTLSDNHARFSGGAVSFGGGGPLSINRCTMAGNSASPDPGGTWYTRGGAIFVSADNSLGCTLTVSDCTLTGNSAGYQGGAIFETTSGYGSVSMTVSGCSLSGNTAATAGGAIYMTSNGYTNVSVSMAVNGCYLFGNTASSGGGGAIFNSAAVLTVSNSTFGRDPDGILVPNSPDNIVGTWTDGGGNTFA